MPRSEWSRPWRRSRSSCGRAGFARASASAHRPGGRVCRCSPRSSSSRSPPVSPRLSPSSRAGTCDTFGWAPRLCSSSTRLARCSPRPTVGAPTRLARARRRARLRSASSLDDVRVGLACADGQDASHLLSSADPDVFASVLARSIGIEAPGPSGLNEPGDRSRRARRDPHARLLPASAQRRLVVVFTDGESRPFDSARLRIGFRPAPGHLQTIVIRFWGDEERVYTRGLPDVAYRPDSGSAKAVRRLRRRPAARSTVSDDLDAATKRAREVVEGAPATAIDRDLTQTPLAPYLIAVDSRPARLLLVRRSRQLPGAGRGTRSANDISSAYDTEPAGDPDECSGIGGLEYGSNGIVTGLGPASYTSGRTPQRQQRRDRDVGVDCPARCTTNADAAVSTSSPATPAKYRASPTAGVPSFCGTSCRPSAWNLHVFPHFPP